MATRIRIDKQLQLSSTPGSILATNTSNEANFIAPNTGADHLWFYDHSATALVPLTLGTNLSISGTTLNATAGAGGYSVIQEEGSTVGASNTTLNFIGAGFTAADAGGGVTSLTLDATLNALAAYNTNGLLTQTSADTFVGRTLTGTSDRITITNGSGVSGNPTVDIASTYVGQTSITTLGTIATGTWQGTTVGQGFGGTGFSTYTTGDMLYASATNTLSKRAIGSSGNFLRVSGGVPTWTTAASTDLSDTASIAMLNQNETVSGTWTFSNNITMNGTPSASTDVITVGYLQTQLANQSRTHVRVATTANITLSGEQTIDGVTTSASVVLVKDQSTAAQNGIYTSASGSWTRHASMDTAAEVDGTFVIVEDGSTNAGTFWYTISEVSTLGTDAITWIRLDKATDITAGTGLAFSGLTLNVGTASTSRIVVNANDIDLATTAVTPGSYGSASQIPTYTVDAYGRLTAASNTAISITASAITDFEEVVQDTVNTMLVEGDGITLTYNDPTGELTIDAANIYNSDGTIPASIARLMSFGDATSTFSIENSLTGVLANFTHNSVTFLDGQVGIDNDSVTISTSGGTLEISSDFLITLSGIGDATITDTRTTTRGIEYDDDYSADFTDRTLVDKEYVDNAITSVTTTVNRYYVESSTSSTIDLNANDGTVKDIDGTTASTTIPTNHNKIKIYRNGMLLNETGSLTTRDYSLNNSTHVITLVSALTASEILLVEIIQ